MPKKHTLEELTKYGEIFDLHIKITKKIIDTIRKLHFECGTTIPDLRNKLKEELLELGWFKNGKIKKGISDLILKILGYDDWDSYAVNRNKIYRERKLYLLNKYDLKSVKGLSDYAKRMELNIEITPEIIEKIKKLHYEQGAGIQKITIELESELKPLGWMQENSVRFDMYTRTLKPRLKKNISEIIVLLLGYENYENYKKGQLKLHQNYKTKLRTDSGFNAKLKKEVKKISKGKCVICESIKQLEVHHIDSNFENNEKENLSFVCKKCHIKIRKNIIYYDYTNRCFIENTYYKIWKEKNIIKIKLFYDQKLNKIIKSIDSFFRKWDAKEKFGTSFIIRKLIEFLKINESKYGFIYMNNPKKLEFIFYDLISQRILSGFSEIDRPKQIKYYLNLPLKKIKGHIKESKFVKFIPSIKMYNYLIGKRKRRPKDKGNWYLYEIQY